MGDEATDDHFLILLVASDQSLLDTPSIESVCILGRILLVRLIICTTMSIRTVSFFSGALSNFFSQWR